MAPHRIIAGHYDTSLQVPVSSSGLFRSLVLTLPPSKRYNEAMYTHLDTETLKTGETLEIGLVEAPDETLAGQIERLLAHKGEEWREHIHAALQGETDRLETRFYLGLLDGESVANIMTVESLGVGILGHVFTRPEHRRKGICRAVMARQMEHFRQRGGHVLTLGTGFDSPPYWIYHSFGFRSLKGGFMRYSVEPDRVFEERWFAPGPAKVVPAEWRHGPLIALVASFPGSEYLRSAAWKVFGIGNLEGPMIQFMHDRRENPAVNAVMLETEHGAVAGCATVHPMGSWPGVWLVDVFTHPNFFDRTADLVNGVPAPTGRLIAMADAEAAQKAALLESCGFEQEGTLRRFLRAGETIRDVRVYAKEHHKDTKDTKE
jgi:GNAT superfamily N-acetyltransferase